MNRRAFFGMLALLSLALVIFSGVASAAEGKVSVYAVDRMIDIFKDESAKWVTYFQQQAKWLFWVLATISLVMKFVPKAASGFKGDFGDFFTDMLQYIITTGFFYWLLLEGPTHAHDIIESFRIMGTEASMGKAKEALSPNGILVQGLKLFQFALKGISKCGIIDGLSLVFGTIMTLVVFVLIAAKMSVLLVGAWLTAYGGVIYLGFGGSSITRDMAINYIKGILGMAVKVMAFTLIVGIGLTIIENTCLAITTIKQIDPETARQFTLETGMPYPEPINSDLVNRNDMFLLFAISLVLLIISFEVPDIIAGFVSGSHVGSMSSTVTMTSMMHAGTMAAGVATGGAANVAGGMSALSSAAKQTSNQLEAGASIFRGSNSAGSKGFSEGFQKAMGTGGMLGGASFAARAGLGMAGNIAKGALTAVGSRGSRSTMGNVADGVKLNTVKEAGTHAQMDVRSTNTPAQASLMSSSKSEEGGVISGKKTDESAPGATGDSTPSAQSDTLSSLKSADSGSALLDGMGNVDRKKGSAKLDEFRPTPKE